MFSRFSGKANSELLVPDFYVEDKKDLTRESHKGEIDTI